MSYSLVWERGNTVDEKIPLSVREGPPLRSPNNTRRQQHMWFTPQEARESFLAAVAAAAAAAAPLLARDRD